MNRIRTIRVKQHDCNKYAGYDHSRCDVDKVCYFPDCDNVIVKGKWRHKVMPPTRRQKEQYKEEQKAVGVGLTVLGLGTLGALAIALLGKKR